MHPGPVNRGVEIESALADSPRSVILQQVTNGIAVRMAVLYLLSGAAAIDFDSQAADKPRNGQSPRGGNHE